MSGIAVSCLEWKSPTKIACDQGNILDPNPWMSPHRSEIPPVLLSSAPRCGSGPKCRLEAPPPPPPLRPRTPPAHQPGPPPPGALRKRCQGGWGEEGRRGRAGNGFGLREGSSNYNGGWGGPSKHHLGPDPHLGAPNAGNSMTGSERPSPEPLLKKEASPAVPQGGENSGNALDASNAFNYRAWGIPAVLSREIPGNALRAFPGSFRNFSGICSGKSQPYWGCGPTETLCKPPLSVVLEMRPFFPWCFSVSLVFFLLWIPCFFLNVFCLFSRVFLDFLFFLGVFCCREIPWFFLMFSYFPGFLKGSQGEKNSWCFWGFPWYFQKVQGKEGQSREESAGIVLRFLSHNWKGGTAQGGTAKMRSWTRVRRNGAFGARAQGFPFIRL